MTAKEFLIQAELNCATKAGEAKCSACCKCSHCNEMTSACNACVEEIILAAVAEERERCAKVADSGCLPEAPTWQQKEVADAIAAAIREASA